MGFSERIAAAAATTSDAAHEVRTIVARESASLTASWDELSTELADCQAEQEAIKRVIDSTAAAVKRLVVDHLPEYRDRVRPVEPRASVHRPLVVRGQNGELSVRSEAVNPLNSHLRRALEAAREASTRFFGARFRDAAAQHLDSVRALAAGFELELKRAEAEEGAIRERQANETTRLRADADRRLGEAVRALAQAEARLPPAMAPWSSPSWANWSPALAHSHVLMGRLKVQPGKVEGPNSDFAAGVTVPAFAAIREGLHLEHEHATRESAHGLARSLILRALASAPPGKLRLSIFDPTGLGQSVASVLELAEYDRELLGGKVWSSPEDLRRLLSEQSAHLELVIQKYLRAEYATLEQFNEAAGEIAEPYRLLVVFDFPERFDETSFSELRRVVENGPRCGVATLLVSDRVAPRPHGVEVDALPPSLTRVAIDRPFEHRIEGRTVLFDLVPETDHLAPKKAIDSIVNQVGRAAQTGTSAAVAFDRVFSLFNDAALLGRKQGLPRLSAPVMVADEATWWAQTTTESVTAPIGQRGARDVANLTFDSSDHAGALLVGRPGSGKSTLLHTFIAGITTLYGPEELELHLIDFKEGVEFKVYAAGGLPHARSVAIESDREFGVSVLQAIQAELSWRGSLLRGSSGAHASLETLRKSTGERLPRIVLIFDEFQVLFARHDKLGAAAAEILELLIRQGRGFGIHVLLGSQSLSGLDALGSHVPQLLPVRILLPASEADAFRVLGEGNTEGTRLTSAGDGILNMSGGAVEANERFRGAVIVEAERRERVRRLRERADATGFHRRPIVFEGNAPIPATDTPPDQFRDEIAGADSRTLRLRFGAPMAIAGTADIDLRREAGGNVLLVARDSPPEAAGFGSFSVPRAVTANITLSAAARRATVEVVDFLPIDEGLEATFAPLVESGVIRLNRRRQVPDLLKRIHAEVEQRVEEDDTSGPATLLVLYGMHRARDFDQDSLDFDSETDLPGMLGQILRDGPEVGVHTFIWFDTIAGISRRLPPQAVREASWRLAGRMSADDSSSFIGVDTAASLRDQQVLSANEDRGLLQRCTAIGEPPAEWIRDLLTHAQPNPKETIQ